MRELDIILTNLGFFFLFLFPKQQQEREMQVEMSQVRGFRSEGTRMRTKVWLPDQERCGLAQALSTHPGRTATGPRGRDEMRVGGKTAVPRSAAAPSSDGPGQSTSSEALRAGARALSTGPRGQTGGRQQEGLAWKG